MKLAPESARYERGAEPRRKNGQFAPGVHSFRKPQPYWDREWLRREYEDRKRSAGEIARELGLHYNAITFWLAKHGIPRRTISEARKVKHWGVSGAANPMFGKTGAANHRYVDGSSPERQRMYVRSEGREFLARILRRDRYRCVRCRAPNRGKKWLHVHHIRPWAGNRALRFEPTNVVTLCRPCHNWVHSKKNTKREFLRGTARSLRTAVQVAAQTGFDFAGEAPGVPAA